MNLTLSLIGDAGSAIKNAMDMSSKQVWRAAGKAANQAASQMQTGLRNDIASAGKFGGKWIDGLTTQVVNNPPNLSITVTHSIPFASIFDTGAVITGKPLLWIPLSYTGLTVKASQFGGGLVRVNRGGKPPLLISTEDHKPKYVGVASVTLKKLFHFSAVIDKVMSGFDALFAAAMKAK